MNNNLTPRQKRAVVRMKCARARAAKPFSLLFPVSMGTEERKAVINLNRRIQSITDIRNELVAQKNAILGPHLKALTRARARVRREERQRSLFETDATQGTHSHDQS